MSGIIDQLQGLTSRVTELEKKWQQLETKVNSLQQWMEDVTEVWPVPFVRPRPGPPATNAAALFTATRIAYNNHTASVSVTATAGNSTALINPSARRAQAACAVHRARVSSKLMKAVQNENLEEIRKCLSRGAAIAYRDPTIGCTVLHEAVGKGSIWMTLLFLQAGAPLEARCDAGRTPLHWAAEKGRFECLQALIASGANLNARSAQGWTPLHSAAANGHVACVRVLLDAGADTAIANNSGKTPKEEAAHNTRSLFI